MEEREIVIIGGGLAGLITGLQLNEQDRDVLIIEKKEYPFHRVCGEYISNEVFHFMNSKGYLPDLDLPKIKHFTLSNTRGKKGTTPLDLGGFGISRYTLDHHLYLLAKARGVQFKTGTNALDIVFENNYFTINTNQGDIRSEVLVGAFGKRSNLDQALERPFFSKRSPYIGVKYHVRSDVPDDSIALHNFSGGYCGVSRVENGTTNICYLSKVENLKRHETIEVMQEKVLFQNPELKELFSNAEFVFDKPEVINEISFETKGPVEDHILMAGDAAGMITPLCGNGMAMAIHAGKMLSEEIARYFESSKLTRIDLEENYKRRWEDMFKQRLWIGRKVQLLFGNAALSNTAVGLINSVKPLSNLIIRNTHGQPIPA